MGIRTKTLTAILLGYGVLRIPQIWRADCTTLDNASSVFVDLALVATGGQFGWYEDVDLRRNAGLRASLGLKRFFDKYFTPWPWWRGESFTVRVVGVDVLVTRPVPSAADSTKAPPLRPLVLYTHKGGMAMGHAGERDVIPRLVEAGYVVASVEYPLAPEHPFPAAVVALEAVMIDLVRDRPDVTRTLLGADPERFALVGYSAGGNLAAVLARIALVNNIAVRAHVVINGMLLRHDFSDLAALEETYPSLVLNREVPSLLISDLAWFWRAYTTNSRAPCDARCQPLAAKSFEGLSPAIVFAASADVLYSEGLAYVEALADAGVETRLVVSRGTHWGSVLFDTRAIDEMLEHLARLISRPSKSA